MTLDELLLAVKALSPADKAQVMRVLMADLGEKYTSLLKPGMTYEVWSPHDAHDAASDMLKALKAAEKPSHA